MENSIEIKKEMDERAEIEQSLMLSPFYSDLPEEEKEKIIKIIMDYQAGEKGNN